MRRLNDRRRPFHSQVFSLSSTTSSALAYMHDRYMLIQLLWPCWTVMYSVWQRMLFHSLGWRGSLYRLDMYFGLGMRCQCINAVICHTERHRTLLTSSLHFVTLNLPQPMETGFPIVSYNGTCISSSLVDTLGSEWYFDVALHRAHYMHQDLCQNRHALRSLDALWRFARFSRDAYMQLRID